MPTKKAARPSRVLSRRVAPFAPLALAALSGHLTPEGIVENGNARVAREESSTSGTALHLACTLPFDRLKARHPIDDSCGEEGSSAPDTPQAAQNTAKNDFCASSSPVTLTFQDFIDLQNAAQAAHVSFGSDRQLPKDRTPLASLLTVPGAGAVGEGSVVRLAAFVINAHPSNVSSGETVNCKTKGAEWNDIHIVLGEHPDDDACSSVTAEMSPHFRPDLWTPGNLNGLSGHPLRFTGQLFFDASHRPCTKGSPANPPRESLFEIHPVYAVDVCRTKPTNPENGPGASCDASVDADWVGLDSWLGEETPDGSEND